MTGVDIAYGTDKGAASSSLEHDLYFGLHTHLCSATLQVKDVPGFGIHASIVLMSQMFRAFPSATFLCSSLQSSLSAPPSLSLSLTVSLSLSHVLLVMLHIGCDRTLFSPLPCGTKIFVKQLIRIVDGVGPHLKRCSAPRTLISNKLLCCPLSAHSFFLCKEIFSLFFRHFSSSSPIPSTK